MNNQDSSSKEHKKNEAKSFFIFLLILTVIFIALTLPFHIIIGDGGATWRYFPKESLTFNHTFTTSIELGKISVKYHEASPSELQEMNVDPFIRRLIEEDALYTVKDIKNDDGTYMQAIYEK
jgi:hypothetical protein